MRLGHPFGLRLGRRAIVGWRPDWNRRVLTDMATFRSRGSLSAAVPHLAGGVILTDEPQHAPRRRALNPHFFPREDDALRERLRHALAPLMPRGRFNAVAWADAVARTALNAALFDGQLDSRALGRFLDPLHRSMPAPLLPRPWLFLRTDRALRRALRAIGSARAGTGAPLACPMNGMRRGIEEARVVLAAGHDTTAHALSWAAWHIAADRRWQDPALRQATIRETLRLYPPGWIGSRRAAEDTEIDGCPVPRGTLVLYSSWLTHRDPSLWPEPERFDPSRFTTTVRPWSYVPFGGGPRVCLGQRVAEVVLDLALEMLSRRSLTALDGDPSPRPGLTLAPRGPLWLSVG
jgi:cytochrome P450